MTNPRPIRDVPADALIAALERDLENARAEGADRYIKVMNDLPALKVRVAELEAGEGQ